MILPEGNQDLIDTLILEGALVISGVDSDTGDIVYTFTDKLKEMAPDLYDGFIEMIQQSVMSLWEKGFVNMNVTEQNPKVSLTKMTLNKEAWNILNDTEIQTIKALMRALGEEA